MRKRTPRDFQQSHALNEDEAKARLKHQILLQEYLELQKEFVSKKRKLQTTRQKREILLEEVRFLRRRCRQILKTQSSKLDDTKELVQPQNAKKLVQVQNSEVQRKLPKGRNCIVGGPVLENPCLVFVSDPNLRGEDEEGKGREAVREPLMVERKHKNHSIRDERFASRNLLAI